MKHHFCRRHTIHEWNVQTLDREILEPKRLKLLLLHRNILNVSELVMSTGSGWKRPHTAYGDMRYKFG